MKYSLFVLVMVGAFAQTEPRPDWRATLSRAVHLRETGSDEAQSVFSGAAVQARTAADGLALAQVLNEFAIDHQLHGRQTEAESLLRQVLAIYDGNPRTLPLDRAATIHNLAITCRAVGRWQEAEALYRTALQTIERAAGPDSLVVIFPLSFLGALYVEQGRLVEAEPLFIRALRIGSAINGPNHPNLVPSLSGLASLRRLRGDFDAARRFATRALRLLESSQELEGARTVAVLNELGLLEFETGRLRNAAAHWQRALRIVQKSRAPDHVDALNIQIQLGDVAALERRYADAEGLFLAVVRAADGPEGLGVLGVSLHHLAVLYASQNQHERAEGLFRRSLALTEKAAAARTTEWASTAADFARTLLALKRTEEAEVFQRAALAVAEQTIGLWHPAILKILQEHERTLRKLDRKQEARQVAERARSLIAAGAANLSLHTVSATELKVGR